MCIPRLCCRFSFLNFFIVAFSFLNFRLFFLFSNLNRYHSLSYFILNITYFQVESELAGLGQEDRDMFLEDMGVTDEECGLHVSTETDFRNKNNDIHFILFYLRIEWN